MFRIMSRNKYDSLIRENAELKNANANLEDKLDQLKAEKAVNSKYKCGEYCRACENGYEIPSYTIDRAYVCLLNTECESFVKTGIGQDEREPLHTVTTSAGHFGEVRAFLIKYYGSNDGQNIKQPLDTVTTHDRFGLVTIKGVDYQIVDIGLRMLEPRELYGCQGFPDDYIIDHDYSGKSYPRSEQVKRCGNAVCPPIPAALVRANLPEMCLRQRMPNMKVREEETGQLKFA